MFDNQTRREFLIAFGFASVVTAVPVAASSKYFDKIVLDKAKIGSIAAGRLTNAH